MKRAAFAALAGAFALVAGVSFAAGGSAAMAQAAPGAAKYCAGMGNEGTAQAGGTDTCTVFTTQDLNTGATVFVTPLVPADVMATACSGTSVPADDDNGDGGYSTSAFLNPVPASNPTASAGRTGCGFTVNGFVPAGSVLGTETLTSAATSNGGTLQQNAGVCSDRGCSTVLSPDQPMMVYGPGATIQPANNTGTAGLTKRCSGPNSDGSGAAGGSDTCTITTTGALSAGSAVFVTPLAPAGGQATACTGSAGTGYTISARVNPVPAGTGTASAGHTGCRFDVSTGTVPAGSVIGTETLSFPANASGTLQQNGSICGDPSCNTVVLPEQPMTITGPGAQIRQPGTGTPQCTPSNTRPGNGYGDDNHCHTGSGDDNSGNGGNGNGRGNGGNGNGGRGNGGHGNGGNED